MSPLKLIVITATHVRTYFKAAILVFHTQKYKHTHVATDIQTISMFHLITFIILSGLIII